MKLKNLLADLRLSVEAKGELDRLMTLPEVKDVLSREDDRNLARRVELRKKLAEIPGRHAKAIAEAVRTLAAATAGVTKAEAALESAKEAHQAAVVQHLAAETAPEHEAAALLRELRDTRDKRADDLQRELHNIREIVRYEIHPTFTTSRNYVLGTDDKKWSSNLATVGATGTLLVELMQECTALAGEALSHDAMTKRLQDICQRAQAALDRHELNGPTVGDDGEIQPPKKHSIRCVVEEKTVA